MSSQTTASSSLTRLLAVNPDAVVTEWMDFMDECRTKKDVLQIMDCESALQRVTNKCTVTLELYVVWSHVDKTIRDQAGEVAIGHTLQTWQDARVLS